LVNGYIQFSLPGGNEKKAGFGKQTIDAAGDENSVIFTKDQEPQFVELRLAIENAMVARSAPQVVTQVAAGPTKLEQLKQIGELRDSGILTDEEFEVEKARIMNDTAPAVTPHNSVTQVAETATSETSDDSSAGEEETSKKGKIPVGRIAGAWATGGLSEGVRFAKKLKNKE
jgi:hypothetical protein